MMKAVLFAKLVGAGNDFVLVDNRGKPFRPARSLARLAVEICDRKRGAGADGLLAVERSTRTDVRMRYYNADGSEGEMCGNGARCFAYYIARERRKDRLDLTIQTAAGPVQAVVRGRLVRIKLTAPRDAALDLPLRLDGRTIRAHFINTGVPHAVIFVDNLDRVDVEGLGRKIRGLRRFAPEGTNVNFVGEAGRGEIQVRTYERGVEAETLACGTGSTAAALITSLTRPGAPDTIRVHTRGGEVLTVRFKRAGAAFEDVWLEGPARLVYKGKYLP